MNRKVYIHVPRTAGNSILPCLLKHFDGICLEHNLRDPDFNFYKDLALKGDDVSTFVRNPIDRALSAYSFLRQGGLHAPDALDAYLLGMKSLSFEEFVIFRLEEASRWQIHFLPQTKWLEGPTKIKYYYFENLQQEYDRLCLENGYQTEKLVKRNASNWEKSVKFALNRKIIKKIKQVYNRDFEVLGY